MFWYHHGWFPFFPLPIFVALIIFKIALVATVVSIVVIVVKNANLKSEKNMEFLTSKLKTTKGKISNKKAYEAQVQIIRLTAERNKKIVWGTINIAVFWWALFIPLIIGIMQLSEIPNINAEIEILKLQLEDKE